MRSTTANRRKILSAGAFGQSLGKSIDVLRELRADQSGAVAIMVALGLPALAGFASLAVDASAWMISKVKLQGVADIAAVSAVASAYAGETSAQAVAEAMAIAAANGLTSGQKGVTVTVNNPPLSGAYAGNVKAYEVIITQPQETSFGGLFGYRPTVRGRAVALEDPAPSGGAACVLVLDPVASKALSLSGGSTLVQAPDCRIAVNSSSPTAANLSGGAKISNTKEFSIMGDYALSGSSTLTATTIKKGVTTADPYTDLAVPNSTGCQYSSFSLGSGAATINPGVYCGSITVSGGATLTMNPGVYIIKGGDFKVSSSNLAANGVGIVLTKDGSGNTGAVTVSGGGIVTLTAPASGAMQGVAIYVDRTAASKNNAISGGSTAAITGSLYFPSQLVTFSGGSSSGSACLQLIAYRLVFSGGSNFGTSCGGLVVPGLNNGGGGKVGMPVE